MTFRANFQTTPENHSRYFIALTQMVSVCWVLTPQICLLNTLGSFQRNNPSSEGLRLTTIEHIQKRVCDPVLRNQFRKASCMQKALITGISL